MNETMTLTGMNHSGKKPNLYAASIPEPIVAVSETAARSSSVRANGWRGRCDVSRGMNNSIEATARKLSWNPKL